MRHSRTLLCLAATAAVAAAACTSSATTSNSTASSGTRATTDSASSNGATGSSACTDPTGDTAAQGAATTGPSPTPDIDIKTVTLTVNDDSLVINWATAGTFTATSQTVPDSEQAPKLERTTLHVTVNDKTTGGPFLDVDAVHETTFTDTGAYLNSGSGSDALRHGGSGGTAHIPVHAANTSDGHLELSIARTDLGALPATITWTPTTRFERSADNSAWADQCTSAATTGAALPFPGDTP